MMVANSRTPNDTSCSILLEYQKISSPDSQTCSPGSSLGMCQRLEENKEKDGSKRATPSQVNKQNDAITSQAQAIHLDYCIANTALNLACPFIVGWNASLTSSSLYFSTRHLTPEILADNRACPRCPAHFPRASQQSRDGG